MFSRMQFESEPEISLEDYGQPQPPKTTNEFILSAIQDFNHQPTNSLQMQFKLEPPEIALEDYEPPETAGEFKPSATQDFNQQHANAMIQFKREPAISLDDYGEQQQPSATQQPQSSEERIISFIREENKSLRAEIATLNGRLTWLTETVDGLKELLYKSNQSQDFERSDFNFPLRTEFDLSIIDKEIGETQSFKYECISEMKRLFSHKSLSKTLKNVMAVELIMDFNIDGVSKKKGLRNYGFFFSALMEAVRLTDSSQSPIKSLQKAMHCVKNNACKRRSRTEYLNCIKIKAPKSE